MTIPCFYRDLKHNLIKHLDQTMFARLTRLEVLYVLAFINNSDGNNSNKSANDYYYYYY